MPQTAELGGSDASAQPGSKEDNPYRLAADLGTLMEHALAVRCDARSISEALNLLDTVIRPRASRLTAHSETPAFNQEITAIWEVRHLTPPSCGSPCTSMTSRPRRANTESCDTGVA